MRKLLGPFLAAALAAATLLALSADQAFADHVQCGDVITQDTTLDSDLIDCPGDGIVIGADNITLDLNGHTIDGSGFSPSSSNGVDDSGGFDNVAIENGTITDFRNGVVFRNVDASTVSRLDLHDALAGIELTFSTGNVLDRNTFAANGNGVELSTAANRNTIARNLFADNHFGIFALPLEGPFPAPLPEGNVIERNSFSGNAKATDIAAGNLNSIDRNTIDSSSDVAIDIGGVSGNSATRNDLADNQLGIRVAGQASDVTLSQNQVTNSGGDGIVIALVPPGGGVVVERNVSSGNGDDGIDVDSTGVTVAKNTANFNADLGIEGVPGVIDGGGNKARGNGNPAQCLNVTCK